MAGTTDGGGNLTCDRAFPKNRRLRCLAHILNNICNAAFAKARKTEAQIDILWKQAKNLVTKFCDWELRLKKGKLTKYVKTRWLTRFEMLESVLKHYDELKLILHKDDIESYFMALLGFISGQTGKIQISFRWMWKAVCKKLWIF